MRLKRKLSKAAVNYRLARARHRCGNCAMFRPPALRRDAAGRCTLVAGTILPGHVCDRWETQ